MYNNVACTTLYMYAFDFSHQFTSSFIASSKIVSRQNWLPTDRNLNISIKITASSWHKV